MKNNIQKNASADYGNEPAARDGELLIGDDLPVTRRGLGAMRITGKGDQGRAN